MMSQLAKVGLVLLSFVIAASVYAFTDNDDVRAVIGACCVGGTNVDGCKGECKNDSVEVEECSDPCERGTPGAGNDGKPGRPCNDDEYAIDTSGNKTVCNKYFCAINTLYFFECKEGEPGTGEKNCKYQTDATALYRYVVDKQLAAGTTCNTSPGYKEATWKCKYWLPPNPADPTSWSTPCWLAGGTCVGEEKYTSSQYKGRLICHICPP